jgi:hypothetical protein
VKPFQAVDNPHNILTSPRAWVQFEYERQRGSLLGLTDYAKRYKLMATILADKNVTVSVFEAMTYLLEMQAEVNL